MGAGHKGVAMEWLLLMKQQQQRRQRLLFMRDPGASPLLSSGAGGCVSAPLAEQPCVEKGKETTPKQTEPTFSVFSFFCFFYFFVCLFFLQPLSVWPNPNSPPTPPWEPFPTCTHGQVGQISLLRLCVGESVMTSLHWVEFRFLVPPPPAEAEPVESRCSAISSEMKVFRSTSCRPLRLLRQVATALEEPPPPPLLLLPLTCVGDPGAPERTLMLAMAPLRPGGG